ncbi:PREDICTED: type-1 protein phosphatase inhibitor 4-like [Hipposideros armiger]|uniref:Type-1 protein phosphatase inhibitor 4-like n=1 Tax=Hipposideros armiger TaxID=186990 RepID=A0A8B7RTN8_HIPAR|nr:PREDICTED: type-1 protein phosphatase inhibitor 4-like [Hipposideros armiger]
MAAYAASHKPIKGILKKKSSMAASPAAEAPKQQSGGTTEVQRKKSQRWDESNILATCRPSYREYDLMKINEPSTSHLSMQDGREDTAYDLETKDPTRATTLDILAEKFAAIDTSEPKNLKMTEPESDGPHTSKTFLDKQEKQRQFELRRKLHCNEGLNIKLARELIARDFQCEEMEDGNEQCPCITNEEKTPAEPGPASDELQT